MPPVSARVEVRETVHGVEIVDPFRWLEDQNSAETRAWIQAQNKHTQAVLGSRDSRAAIEKRLDELLRVERIGAPLARNGRYFYTKQRPTDEQAILYHKNGLKGKEEVFFDPLPLSPDHTISAGFRDITRDGRLAAYWIRKGGEDESEIRIRDMESGKDLPDKLPRDHYRSFAFLRDGSGFYYVAFKALVGSRLKFHKIGTPVAKDEVIFGEGIGPEKGVTVWVAPSGKYLFMSVNLGWAQSDLYFREIGKDTAFKPIVQGMNARFDLDECGDRFAILTDWKAPNRRILIAKPTDTSPDQWSEIVPEGEDSITEVSAVGGKLFVHYLHNVSSRIQAFDVQGKSAGELRLPGIGTAGLPYGYWEEDEAFYSFASFTTPSSVYRYDTSSGKSSLWSQPKIPAKLSELETRQVWFRSKDGTKIPMFLVQKKGLPWDSNRPTYLYAYGGFNVNLAPSFSTRAVMWAEKGGVYAIPNLRGGGEFGEAWHKAGMLDKKQNTFDDFFAAAEWLIANKVTRTEKLAIEGGSNGGLLMGAAITQRPELFGSVVCTVPLLDMVRYHKFLQGPQWTPEYGSADDPKQFKTLYAYSPYHRVSPGAKIPPMLFVTGDSDTRVAPLHARKMTALLQSTVDPKTPVLLHYQTELGHSGGEPISKIVEEQALILGFLFKTLGIPNG